MRKFDARIIWGILLIVGGLLILLQNFGIFEGVIALFWAFVFGGAGLAFLFAFLRDRAHWWAVIPGFTLLGLAALIFVDQFLPQVGDALGGTIFLGGVGLSFWALYVINRQHWWAIIPGGTLFTLALVAGLSSVVDGAVTGGIFFLGLGLTFGLLSVVPTPQGRIKWALIPAAVLCVMGLLIIAAATPLLGYLWPMALILIGLFVIFRTLVSR